MAWGWLPETVHRARAGTGNPFRYLPGLLQRPLVRRVLVIDFVYWCSFAIFQTTFALFTARRFGFDAPKTGYVFAVFGVLGAVILLVGAGSTAVLTLPWVVIPTVLVPFYLTVHLVIFAKLRQANWRELSLNPA